MTTTQDGQPDEPEQPSCGAFDHEWVGHYYGYECAKCGMFVPFGSEPWAPIDDYDEDEFYVEDYYDELYS